MGRVEKSKNIDYLISSSANGVYVFVLEGEGTINGVSVKTRDGIGIWKTNTVSISANANMKFLLMDVPMN
jgi:redox-sensitive bicupin YhaK (pirin superfamily)